MLLRNVFGLGIRDIRPITGAGGGGGTPPQVEAAGPYYYITTPTALAGSVTVGTDTNPTILWTIVSGGTLTFDDASSPTSGVRSPIWDGNGFSEPIVIRLTATPNDGSPVSDTALVYLGDG